MRRIYIAGKLNDLAVDYLLNVHKMMVTAEEVRKAGYSIYVPAIDLLMGIAFGYTKYEDYFNNSQPWLEASDAVFLTPGWETSKGTEKEIKTALEKKIPVFDNLTEMNNYFLVKNPTGIIIGLQNLEPDYHQVSPIKAGSLTFQ